MTGWRQWLWIPIWLIGSRLGSGSQDTWWSLAAVLLGVAVGAAWQTVARRDVADRLMWLAGGTVLFGLVLTIAEVLTGSPAEGGVVGALYFACVAAAVVLTEQVLRRRDLGPVTLEMVHAPETDATRRQQG